jgi:two-component system, NarL family, sensor histidine kinase DesK
VGMGNFFIAQQKRADYKLNMAHSEIEQLAALAERERIARDLHDVLGHTLSVIVLKAELAGRLMERDSQRAAQEIADVEKTARTALADVRQAIGGYRSQGLPAEMELARNTLQAAGVALACESPLPKLNAAEETVLCLSVREAVTNIVRHAHASECRVGFATTSDGFHSVVIEDNGSHPVQQEGNGLRGMRERVQALGGRFSIDNHQGTTLLIELPIGPRAVPANGSCVVQ